jgi:probable rRNA maturation factor
VTVHWKGLRRWFDDAHVRRAARAALSHGGRPGTALSLVFVDDRELARLHGRWLGDHTRTDVITFDLSDDLAGPAGEIYAGAECARRVAARRGGDPERELALYVVHGALHLCGFDDRSTRDRARMRRAEADVMKSLGYAPDPGEHDLGRRST